MLQLVTDEHVNPRLRRWLQLTGCCRRQLLHTSLACLGRGCRRGVGLSSAWCAVQEKDEFVENIMRDLQALGFDHDALSHTSDHFAAMLACARKLIAGGVLYADDTPVEQMREVCVFALSDCCMLWLTPNTVLVMCSQTCVPLSGRPCENAAALPLPSCFDPQRVPCLLGNHSGTR